MKTVLLTLPDELAEWRGTAAELADQCNQLLEGLPSLTDDAGSANERLVRHYVQARVLTAPEREGREALFGLRQIVEFLATRYLLRDGWPLAKVAEILRTTDVAGLTQLIPSERPPTQAEEVLAKYSEGRAALEPGGDQSAVRRGRSNPARPVVASLDAPPSVPKGAAGPPVTSVESPLTRAADISRRRVSLEENLKALGNLEGRPDRNRIVRIDLTPWCQVSVHAQQLADMTEDTPAILGAALIQALQEERIRKGR